MGVLNRLQPRHTILKDFYVLDVETGDRLKDGSIQFKLNARPESFIFGVIHGRNYTQIFESLEVMKQELLTPRFKDKYVFGHNVPYDLTCMYGNIFTLDQKAVFNGSRFICCTNGVCTFGDSMNVLGKVPLKKIGEMIGIEKPQLGDASMLAKDGLTPDVINRCTTDCQITYDALFMVFNKGGDIKLTGPSLALSNFRRYYQPHAIKYNEHVTRFFDSYYGGRTEAFKLGKTNSHVIDVNSMYPYVYRDLKFPNPEYLNVERPTIKSFLANILPFTEGQITCTVKHKENYFGYLPYKHKGKLLFPTGTFTGTWCFPEIRLALSHNVVTIEGIENVCYAQAMPSPFTQYVDDYYKIKQDSKNKFEIDRVKHLLNDLYGKFGQRASSESIYIDDIQRNAALIWDIMNKYPGARLVQFNRERTDAYLVYKAVKNYKIPHQIPCIASYITSASRVHLLKEMIRMQGNRVTYCDTDSIFFEVNNNFQSSNELGGWKLEPKIILEIRGLKNYSYIMTNDAEPKRIDRIKGIPKRAVQDSDGTWRYTNLINTKEAIRRNVVPGVVVQRSKIVTGKYDKRIVLADGETQTISI